MLAQTRLVRLVVVRVHDERRVRAATHADGAALCAEGPGQLEPVELARLLLSAGIGVSFGSRLNDTSSHATSEQPSELVL